MDKATANHQAAPADSGAPSQSIELSIVIPAYNEAGIISQTLEKVRAYVDAAPASSEVIVVDDGSIDSTAALTTEFTLDRPTFRLISNVTNQGKGFSIKHGVSESRGKFVLFTDADLSTPIQEADKLLHSLRTGFDVAIGIRGIRSQAVYVPQPRLRRWAGKTFALLTRAIAGIPFGDTQCGFKAYTKEAANNIFPRQRIKGFAFDVENLFLARKLGYRVKAVPVDWVNNPDSRVNFLKDSMRMLADLAVIRINSLLGRYR